MLSRRMCLRKWKYGLWLGITIMIYVFLGIGDHLHETSYENEFNYPLDIDIKPMIEQLLNGQEPEVQPINTYPYEYNSFTQQCLGSDLVILVKSARRNFKRRVAIRRTWGSEHRFTNVTITLVFFLGTADDGLDAKINKENKHYNDIVQSNFYDTYYNNTIKTMLTFKWAYIYCNSRYYLFSDDDMYISIVNLLKYINSISSNELYSGYMFKSAPHRHYASKWRVSLDEYPYDKWPPYVTAGAYIISSETLKRLYLGSLYTKHFRFDDIYLGLVARKAGVVLTHCNQFYFYKKTYRANDYKNVIASHGYGDQYELMKVWIEQNMLGYA